MTSFPVWHNMFRAIKLKGSGPDKVLTAETYKDTLNIVAGPGVSWGGPSTIEGDFSDTFEINVDYDISIPVTTTKISLEDVNGNLSEVNLKAGKGMIITRNNSHELQFESFSITETDTLQTITSRNNITTNKIFVNNLEVGEIVSDINEDGFTGYDSGHDLIGNGTLSDPLRFSPLYKKSLDTNITDDFVFSVQGPGTFSYQANYSFDGTVSSASILLQREDTSSPGTWITLDTITGTNTGIAYSISGIYSELYSGTVNYRIIFNFNNNTGTVNWYVYNTFEDGNYGPINFPQIKTDTVAKTVEINDLQFFQNNIKTTVSNTDIVLDPSGTGKVIALSNITAPTFTGNLTGNVLGNVTGNVLGNVTGDVSGNAGTVTNGVYTTGSYSNPTWLTSLDGSKITNAVLTTGSYSNPTWLTSLDGSKITNAVLTTGSYSNPTWLTSLDGSKIFGSVFLSDLTIDENLRFFDNVISTTQSNSDIVLDASGNGKVISLSDIIAPTFTGNLVGNASTVTNGVYTTGLYSNPDWITNIDASKISGSISLSDITIDNTIKIFNNVIETISSNANLELRANGSGIVFVSDGLTVDGTLTTNSDVNLSPTNKIVTISPIGTGSITINPAAASTMNNVSIIVPAGTTTVAPFKMTSGTNLTTASAGAMEFDGTVLNFTTNTTVGRSPVQQMIFTSGISASNSGTVSANTSYAIFPNANDTINLPAGTYSVELNFRVDTSAATSNALAFTIVGGGTASGLLYAYVNSTNTNTLPATTSQTRIASALGIVNITAAVATATQRVIFIKGILRIGAPGGTIIPSIQFTGNAGTMTFYADNYMIISPISNDASVISTGNWS